MRIVILGLSITSSWGNGHATTYRSLVKALARRGHDALFLERDVPWYTCHRDTPKPAGCRTELYENIGELKDRFFRDIADADIVMVGSFVPEGVAVGNWITRTAQGVTAFYDIDTPVTLARLERSDEEYLSRSLVSKYDLYLSFTGGPTLERLEREYGSPCARVFYCSADPDLYYPEEQPKRWLLGYLGTYSEDRQPGVERLLNGPARRLADSRFIVAGPLYPSKIEWPRNVERIDHLSPPEHRGFYNSQNWTLNITRADMTRAGWSPSVRLFEAGACGTPVLSDCWQGLEELFRIGEEIMVARTTEQATRILKDMPDAQRKAIGARMRARVLAEHTAERRAEQLEGYILERTRSMAGALTHRR